jgi:hypothetical protein
MSLLISKYTKLLLRGGHALRILTPDGTAQGGGGGGVGDPQLDFSQSVGVTTAYLFNLL